jgi:hypothetical protein
LLKLAFNVSTMLLCFLLFLPVHFVLRALFEPPRGRRDTGLVLDMLIIFVCLGVADRVTSFAFRVTRQSDERWSIFSRGPRRRAH